jgi:hypothetical protein
MNQKWLTNALTLIFSGIEMRAMMRFGDDLNLGK